MARPRATLISLNDTPFYHCISRCVRRAFLCGKDPYSGQSYEHRREWIEKRLIELTQVFAIDICAYAVMSNHLHVVLRVDADKAAALSDQEVLLAWHSLFKGTLLTHRFVKGDVLQDFELQSVKDCINIYRKRIIDISWFMRALNEPIARQANREDSCTGRFWEGRFKSQALLDEAALLACMAYVDLNPIRAGIAATPEQSDFTSIKRRIRAALKGEQSAQLLPFVGNERAIMPKGLSFTIEDYLVLVDQTGRIVREDKPGHINHHAAAILSRLNISPENWLKLSTEFESLFKGPAGNLQQLTQYCAHLNRKRRQSMSNCQKWFGTGVT